MNPDKSQIYHRTLHIDRARADEESRSVEVAFSSEAPVERAWGNEVLDHAGIDLSRMERAPVLLNHDPDAQVGVVDSARVDPDGVGRARLRFSRSRRAQEVFQDIRDGIRGQVSVGYRVNEVKEEARSEDSEPTFRVTSWTPLEVSLVAIAADASVGVGRSIEMSEITRAEKRAARDEERSVEYQTSEQYRVREITAIGTHFECPERALDALGRGVSVDAFKQEILDWKRSTAAPPSRPPSLEAEIGLSGREIRQYSVMNLLRAQLTKDYSLAPFEMEASRAVAQKFQKEPQGGFIPYDVLAEGFGQRDLAKSGSAGNTIGTDHRAQDFVGALRPRSVVLQAGATVLPGLIGDISIPRQTAAATTNWVAEAGTNTAVDQVFDAISMAPETLTGRTNMTRKTLLQAQPAIEGIVRNDLTTIIAIEIDRAALDGSGTGNEPLGVFGQTGVNATTYTATDGTTEFQSLIAMESAVAADNADLGSLAYITTPEWRGRLKGLFRDAGSGREIWEVATGNGSGLGPQIVNGYRAFATNQVPKDKGVGTDEHVLFYGNWDDLLIGQWGTIDVLVDQYTLADSGGLVVHVFQDIDIAVRHGESFATTTFAV